MNGAVVLFWIFASTLLASALWAVLRPLLRRDEQANATERSASLALYRARIMELEEDIAGGAIGPAEENAVRAELERDLLAAADREQDVSSTAPVHNRTAAIVLGVLLTGVAVALYLYLGRPDLTDGRAATEANAAAAQLAAIEGMVSRLAAKVEQNPDDRQGWKMLAQSYLVLGRYPEAAAAAEKLYALAGDEPDVMVRLADTLSRVNGGRLSGRPAELLQKALALAPHHRAALWLAGAAAAESGDQVAAATYWEKLLPLVQNEPEVRARVEEVIVRARLASDSPATGEAAGSIRVHVELAPALSDQVPPDATLFVVAKASDGPPMPLAVARRTARELPLDITLDDSMGMAGAARLSGYERVDLSARISRSGQAERQTGDLIGELRGVDVGEGTAKTIVIETLIP